jgi:hypothetical protein
MRNGLYSFSVQCAKGNRGKYGKRNVQLCNSVCLGIRLLYGERTVKLCHTVFLGKNMVNMGIGL